MLGLELRPHACKFENLTIMKHWGSTQDILEVDSLSDRIWNNLAINRDGVKSQRRDDGGRRGMVRSAWAVH